jgi:hypothetical protein
MPKMWQIISTGSGTARRCTTSKAGRSSTPAKQRSTISSIAVAISLMRGGVNPLPTMRRIRVCWGGSAAAIVLAEAISAMSTGMPEASASSRSSTSGFISSSGGAAPS